MWVPPVRSILRGSTYSQVSVYLQWLCTYSGLAFTSLESHFLSTLAPVRSSTPRTRIADAGIRPAAAPDTDHSLVPGFVLSGQGHRSCNWPLEPLRSPSTSSTSTSCPSTSCTMADMMQAGDYESLQLLRNQGLFRRIVKQQGPSLRAQSREEITIFIVAILVRHWIYYSDCIGSTFSQITHSVLSILLRAKGTICKSKPPPAWRQALLFLVCCLSPQTTGVRAEPQNGMVSAPNAWVWDIGALKALAATILAAVAMTTIWAAVAGRMFRHIAPLVPAIPAAVDALPIIPLVEGDDFDDVLARAPTPTRLNSPLSWL